MAIKRIVAAMSICLILTAFGCSSSSGDSAEEGGTEPVDPSAPGLVQPAILDYETITRDILPNMTDASLSLVAPLSSNILSFTGYAPLEYWTGFTIFPEMAGKALSTNPSTGVESVFNLIGQIQDTIQSIKDLGGFDIDAGACQLPEIYGVVGTATALSGNDSLVVPFLGNENIANYECLITITDYPAVEGSDIISMSYAFGTGLNASDETVISRLAFTLTMYQDTTSSTAYEAFIFISDPETDDTKVDYVIFDDKTDKMAMRARYEGDPDAHSFIFASTLRGDLDMCTPPVTDIEDEAKKLVSRGLSSGTDATFAMNFQRVCDQQALGLPTDPQMFCIDPATQAPTSDETLCLLYSTDVGDTPMIAASEVPFSATDFNNDNLITTMASPWQQIGGGYASSHDSEDSAFYVDLWTEFATSDIVYFDTTSYYLGYASTGDEAFVMQAVPPDFLWQDITPAGGFGDSIDGSVDITATPWTGEIVDGIYSRRNSDIWFAYAYDSPSPTGLRVWRYSGATWNGDQYSEGEWDRITSASTNLDPVSDEGVRNVQIDSDGDYVFVSSARAANHDIYVQYIPTTGGGDWTTACNGKAGSASSDLYAMDARVDVHDRYVAMAYYDGTTIRVKICRGIISDLGGGWENYMTADGIAPGGQITSIDFTLGRGLSYPYVAYTLSSGRGGLNLVTLEYRASNTALVYVGTRNITGGDAEGVHVAGSYPVPYLAFEDVSNGGALTVRQYRGDEWQPAEGAVIDVPGGTIADFKVMEGVPYVLYDVPEVDRLLLMKFAP